MAKAYKNVYTIFEKVKKGELDFTSQPSRFSNISYNLKNEVIKPHLHYIDERGLQKSVRDFIKKQDNLSVARNLAAKYNKKLPAPDALQEQMINIYDKFPKEVINDVFNMYYHEVDKLEFEHRTDKNKFRYKVIEKSNNPITKVMTKQSQLKSMIFTRGFMQYYLTMMAMMEQEDKQAFDDLMQQMQKGDQGNDKDDSQSDQKGQGGQGGQGSGDEQQSDEQSGDGEDLDTPKEGNSPGGSSKGKDQKQTLEQMVDKFMNSQASQNIHNEIMDKAKQTASMMDTIMTKEEMDKTWEDITSSRFDSTAEKALAKTDLNYLKRIEDELKTIGFNMGNIKNKIKNLLDRSLSYFSARETPIYESLFDADSMDGIMDYELFHPKLRKISLEDIIVKDSQKMGKIDIYVDMSGSMQSSCGIENTKGYYITKELFAKAFAYKMKELNLLNEVYSFQNSVKYEGNRSIDILSMSGGGSTDLNKVIDMINRNKRNAIVLTDAEDHCYQYSDYAYFIGVQGARFDYFNSDVLHKYQQGNQICVFDGKRVYNVDYNGRVIE